MKRTRVWLLGLLVVTSNLLAVAQAQTGVVVRRPGEPIRGPVAVLVPPPQPNLAPRVLANFKGTILLRRSSGFFLVRGGDKVARMVLKDAYSVSLAPDGHRIAYVKDSQMHLLELGEDLTQKSDNVLAPLPGARVDNLAWSPDGTKLAYDVRSKTNSGVHMMSLPGRDVHKFPASSGAISFSADGAYVLGVSSQGLIRSRISDASFDVIYRTEYPPSWPARFNSLGLVGILMPVPQPPSDASDDEPDCSGAQLQLDIVDASGKAWTLPFPKGFDNVYDFDFSPDGRQVAVGFGTVGCDYPGDAGAVYLFSLVDHSSRRLTPEGIALRGQFSPDGQQIAYTDFTAGSSPTIFVLDLSSGKTSPLLETDESSMDELADWR